jgi:hypothetical protein
MKKPVLEAIAISVLIVSLMTASQGADASLSVKVNHSNATITLSQTVEFTVEANELCNFTWYCDGFAVQSEWTTSSNYTFTPKSLGTYKVQLAVDGTILPGPADTVTIKVIAESVSSPTQTPSILPYATYHSGDTYTTIYIRNVTSPPDGAKPPIVRILSPANNSVIASTNVTLAFDLIPVASTGFYPDSFLAHYTTSWDSRNISFAADSSSVSITVTEIPEGSQWIRVCATALSGENETGRAYVTNPNTPDGFIVCGRFLHIYSDAIGVADSSSVNFTIDASSPFTPSGQDSQQMGFVGVILAVVLIVTVVCAGLGLLVYLNRRK